MMMPKILQKTLLYNLIIFDFILLETSTKKISNFFFEKFKILNLNKYIFQFSVENIIKSFKQYIRFLKFIKTLKKNIIIVVEDTTNIDFLKLLFKQLKLTCKLYIAPVKDVLTRKNYTLLNNVILLESLLTKSLFLSFFYKKIHLIQSINNFNEKNFSNYKIFSLLDDYKKLLFISLILASIFKK
jgi:hypothetical protein